MKFRLKVCDGIYGPAKLDFDVTVKQNGSAKEKKDIRAVGAEWCRAEGGERNMHFYQKINQSAKCVVI